MTVTEQLRTSLVRFSSGEASYADQVCATLADTNVFVLLSEPLPDENSSAATVVKVALKLEGEQPTAYIFLSPESAAQWCVSSSVPPHLAEMNGADVCVALPERTWIRVDAGQSHSSVLSPLLVIKTSSLGYGPNASKAEPPSAVMSDAPVLVNQNKDFQVGAPADQKPKARHIPRGHPTTFVVSPLAGRKLPEAPLNTGRPRTYTSSNLKKIIRPPGSSSSSSE